MLKYESLGLFILHATSPIHLIHQDTAVHQYRLKLKMHMLPVGFEPRRYGTQDAQSTFASCVLPLYDKQMGLVKVPQTQSKLLYRDWLIIIWVEIFSKNTGLIPTSI